MTGWRREQDATGAAPTGDAPGAGTRTSVARASTAPGAAVGDGQRPGGRSNGQLAVTHVGLLPSANVVLGDSARRCRSACVQGDDLRSTGFGRLGQIACQRDIEVVAEVVAARSTGVWAPDQPVQHRGLARGELHPSIRAGQNVERVTGIEPAWPAWKAGALPLSYTREVPGQPNGRRCRSVQEPATGPLRCRV